MLTPEYMKNLPNELITHYEKLEETIIKDISRRINKAATLTPSSAEQIKVLTNLGYDFKEVTSEITKQTEIGKRTLNRLVKDAGLTSYAYDMGTYAIGGKKLQPYNNNHPVQRLVQAMIKDSREDLTNISRTLGLGNKPLKDYYRDTLGQAIVKVNSGAFSAEEVIRKTINEVAEKGLQVINYESGKNFSVEAAVRMSINSTVNRLSGEMSLMNAEDMGQDLMEITAHMGARPSHAEWQGQIVSLSSRKGYLSLDDIGYDTAGGFMGVNCRHNWYPFFEGISKRNWDDEDLKYIDNPPFEYDGKEYTHYEATQRQRQLERSMRLSKRRLIGYDAVGDKEAFINESIKLQRKRQEYSKFSNAAQLKEQLYRTHKAGYNRSISSKQVYWRKIGER